jgi:hypothetical protein
MKTYKLFNEFLILRKWQSYYSINEMKLNYDDENALRTREWFVTICLRPIVAILCTLNTLKAKRL